MNKLGIRKFENAADAFDYLTGEYSPRETMFPEMFILDDFEYERVLRERFMNVFLRLNTGDFEEWEKPRLEHAAEYGKDGMITDFPIDFNFFLRSDRNQCYYACLETMKDDNLCVPTEEQWDIIRELSETFNVEKIRDEAKNAIEDNNITDWDDMWNVMCEKNWVPFSYVEEDENEKMLNMTFQLNNNQYIS